MTARTTARNRLFRESLLVEVEVISPLVKVSVIHRYWFI